MPGDVMRRWSKPGSSGIGLGSKEARCHEATIVFVDETGLSCRARTATTWAPIGRTPILRRVSRRPEFSTVVGLTLSGSIYKRHFARAIHGDDVVIALRHFQRHIPGPLIIIWDPLNAHRATVVKEYVSAHPEVEVEWLPPYAPDLNPEEGCHGNVKQHLRNATPGSISELRAQVDRGFRAQRLEPGLPGPVGPLPTPPSGLLPGLRGAGRPLPTPPSGLLPGLRGAVGPLPTPPSGLLPGLPGPVGPLPTPPSGLLPGLPGPAVLPPESCENTRSVSNVNGRSCSCRSTNRTV